MFAKSALLVSSALVLITSFPAFAQEQSVDINENTVHIQNGGQDLHVDLKNGTVHIDNDSDMTGSSVSGDSPGMGTDFSNANLAEQSFEGKNLSGAVFINATLKHVSFRNTNLRGADFTNADLDACDLRGANVAGANFTNANFHGTFINGVDFSGATMTNADLEGADQTSFIPTSSQSIARALSSPVGNDKPAFVNLSITFDFDRADLTKEGMSQIAELAAALKSPELASSKLMIEGHTDSKGSDEYNLSLSKRRAQAIVSALTRNYGIEEDHLEFAGYGEMRPIAGNDTDFGRAQNRRVTIVNMGK